MYPVNHAKHFFGSARMYGHIARHPVRNQRCTYSVLGPEMAQSFIACRLLALAQSFVYVADLRYVARQR